MSAVTSSKRSALTRMNNTSYAVDLGVLMFGRGCAVGTYKFSRDGGATGDVELKDINGNPLKLPSGVIIRNVTVHVTTAFTSGGSATLDLNSEAANDCLAAEGVASFSANAIIKGIPDVATVADYKRLTAERTMTMSINVAALTAGACTVYYDFLYAPLT